VAHANYRRLISLPLHPGLSDADVGDVIAAVLDVVFTFRR
jgi:dTDP-4-amino-4,6-dideoxygalactose transaminase